jgi:hypothetical protein
MIKPVPLLGSGAKIFLHTICGVKFQNNFSLHTIYCGSNFIFTKASKETFSTLHNNGIDHEQKLIDEVMLHQRMYKVGAAVDQNVLTGLLLQLVHFFRDILFNQSRIGSTVPLLRSLKQRTWEGCSSCRQILFHPSWMARLLQKLGRSPVPSEALANSSSCLNFPASSLQYWKDHS